MCPKVREITPEQMAEIKENNPTAHNEFRRMVQSFSDWRQSWEVWVGDDEEVING